MTQNINVLSWNTYWESLQGQITDKITGVVGPGRCPGSTTDPTTCYINVQKKINDLIINNNVSLIGLQESGRLGAPLPGVNLPPNFEKFSVDIRGSSVILFAYDRNIFRNITQILFGKNHIADQFPYNGRFQRNYQFVVLELKNNKTLLFINVHFQHQADINGNFKHLDSLLGNTKFDYIVVTGDFNNELSGNIQLNGKLLTIHNTTFNTCCDGLLNGNPMGTRIDNILSYGLNNTKISLPISASQNKNYSDHLPLLGEFNTGIGAQPQPRPQPRQPQGLSNIEGFDFDGVIQKSMGIIDLPEGKRHPDHGSKMIQNPSMINIINLSLAQGNIIHIFSGRANQQEVQNFITSIFGVNPNIILFNTKAINFDTEIQKLTKYYDDSKSVLDKVLSLSPRPELHLVIPEENKEYQINNSQDLTNHFNRVAASYLIKQLVAKTSLKNQSNNNVPETALINQIRQLFGASILPVQPVQPQSTRQVTVYGTMYTPNHHQKDFTESIKTEPNKKFFIYNENFTHYLNKNYTSPGDGNGFLRQFRQDTPNPDKNIFSLGIPTGDHGNIPPNPLVIVDDSIKNIKKFIKDNNNIKEVYYSSNSRGDMGLNVFATYPWSQQNISTITQKLKGMFKELENEIKIIYKII